MSSTNKQIVLVGSTNKVKINACNLAFTKCFPNIEFEFVGVSCSSDVPDQPFGDETRLGAINRAKNALADWKKTHDHLPDFVVGLEGGLREETFDYGINYYHEGMILFAWMAVYSPLLDKWGLGQTGEFMIPPEISKLVKGGMELGKADDTFYGKHNTGHTNGTIGILTHDIIDRTEYYKHALIMALIPFMNINMYP
ncbi:hypothetical protein WA158_005674 [Blastocystis sp. Blastoise]